MLYTLRWWWWSCYASVPYFIPLLKQGKSIYMSSDMLTNTYTLTHTHTHALQNTQHTHTHSTHILTDSHTPTHCSILTTLTVHTYSHLTHSHTLQYTHHIQNHHDQQGRISSWSLWLWGWWTPRKFFNKLSINISIIFLKH